MYEFFISFAICMLLISLFLKYQSAFKCHQPISGYLYKVHTADKNFTPTMGGLPIVFSLLSVYVIKYIWFASFSLYDAALWIIILSYAVIGFVDDISKVIVQKNSKGLSGKSRLAIEALIAFIVVTAVVFHRQGIMNISEYNAGDWSLIFSSAAWCGQEWIAVPLLNNLLYIPNWLYILFAVFIICGAANSANLTDGLDGLLTLTALSAFAYIYTVSHFEYRWSDYLFKNKNEIMIAREVSSIVKPMSSAFIGAMLAFLWYNAKPAKLFMGDVGSLPLGGALGMMAVILKHELAISIAYGVFVIEAMSVIIQVGSNKIFHFRPFKFAPIHHHFEKMGVQEEKIVIRFFIFSVFMCIIGILLSVSMMKWIID